MGFSISATAAVLFIVFMIAGSAAYNKAANGFLSLQDAITERDQLMFDKLNSGTKILNHTVNGSNITLIVENTGSTVIEPALLSALVDGRLVNITVDSDIWFPETTLNITVDTSGKRMKIITVRGVAAYYTAE
jgi:flagellar protein FlaF